MKIGFFGTPEMSAYYLERLADVHEIVFAVTSEDKPKGRHGTPSPTPVKEAANKRNIPVFQPANLNDPVFLNNIFEYNADVFIVVAYAKLIPPAIFNKPPFRMINIHPSLLPRYRGAAPMQWALINGDKETGICIQYISDGWDTGDILLERKISLDENIIFGELYDIVLPLGFDMTIEVLNNFQSGKTAAVKQSDTDTCYCCKIDKNLAHIDWNNDSRKIHNLVRGTNPKPLAWTQFKGKNMKIYRTAPAGEDVRFDEKLNPGCLGVINKKLYAGTGSGYLEILELQPESKKVMDAASFINGYRITKGDCFD